MLFLENREPNEVKQALVQRGMEQNSARIVLENLQDPFQEARKKADTKICYWEPSDA